MTKRFSTLTLLEARQDYEAMFKEIMARETCDERDKKQIRDGIAWARRVLKKQDRIIWWLRYLKAYMLGVTAVGDDADVSDRTRHEAVESFIKRYDPQAHVTLVQTVVSESQGMAAFEHWFSLDYVKIQDYVFGNKPFTTVRDDLKALEREYVEKANARIKSDDPSLKGTSTLIDFGNGWHWVSLNRAACSAEGKAMGHCGNSPRSQSDENILSLRKLKKSKDGSAYWEPHLTFTINEGGELLEMKGRGNQKPAERYHEMIVKLFFHKDQGHYTVQELRGGEWLPENDFSLDDMSESLKTKVLTARPELGDLFDFVDYGGDVSSRQFVDKMRVYCWQKPLFTGRPSAWYDWELVDGHLQYNLLVSSGSSLLGVAFSNWSSSLFSNNFTVLADDPVTDLTFLMGPEEEARFIAGYEKNKAAIEAFRNKRRAEATKLVREEIDARLLSGGDLGEVIWPETLNKLPRSLPIRIKDSVEFVQCLKNKIAPPMRDFLSALTGISMPVGQSAMTHKLRKYDDLLYRQFMEIVQR